MERPQFPPQFYRDLAIENPLGLELTEQDARDWLELKWPEMREWYASKRTRPNWKLRVVKWWSNLSERDLERARQRGARLRRRDEAVALEQAARKTLQRDPRELDQTATLPALPIRRMRRS